MVQNIDVFSLIYSTIDTMLEIINENLIREGLDPTEIVRLRFNRLHQEGSVLEYIKRFHKLQLVVSNQNQGLIEAIFVECFIKGLNEEFRSWVQNLCPKSLSTVYSHAKIHQYYLEGLVEQSETPEKAIGVKEMEVNKREQDVEKPSLSSKDEALLCDWGQKLRDRDGHSDVSGVETSTWEEEFMVSNEGNKCYCEEILEPKASRMFTSPMVDDFCQTYVFKYESNHGVFTGTVTILDEFTLKINGKKIKVSSTRKLEEISWADYKTNYITNMGAKKLNTLMEYEDKMKEVWDSNNSKNGRNLNCTYFEMGGNIEAYDASKVIVHVSIIRNPFELLFGQKQVFFGLYNSLHMEMGLLQQMTCNGDGLYSVQWLSVSDEATFVFDPGGLW